jgi:GH15 family glucan-1,4-alpha-glucosidase
MAGNAATPQSGEIRLEDLGLVGNCQFAAHVARDGAVVWCCLPRFDSEPVFGELLDPDGGRFAVQPASGGHGNLSYLPNTNVLETRFVDESGAFRVLDLAPRFEQYGRSFRPTQLHRILEPITGLPRVRVTCEPRLGWSKARPHRVAGSNHVRFEGFPEQLRLTTDIPISYLDGQPFALTGRRHLVLTWGSPVEEALAPLCERFLAETVRHWQRWVKGCSVPPEFQEEVIRSALTLKLHCFEDTGAIVASTTTSIPEAPGSGRTWDYRYCWLRDAYYVLYAFGLLGQFEERERFTQWLLDVASARPDLDLAPLYRVDGRLDLHESVAAGWAGYGGDGPVRVGNQAAGQRQGDIYGETVLALSPIFLDERFRDEQLPQALDLLVRLTRKAVAVAGHPDAGIWEFRKTWEPQTFSALMSWAAADRAARVLATRDASSAREFREAAAALQGEVLARAWSERRGAFASTFDGHELDASLLQMAPLRFLPGDDARLAGTVDAVARELGQDGWIRRYSADDGLGETRVAFVLCTFWLVEALSTLGRRREAREALGRAVRACSPLGLLAEDYDPAGRLWGNFPQAYSHVGLIHAAFEVSPSWKDVL